MVLAFKKMTLRRLSGIKRRLTKVVLMHSLSLATYILMVKVLHRITVKQLSGIKKLRIKEMLRRNTILE